MWKFSIPSHNIEASFLLAGFTSEPNVYFDRTSINFKSVLVGRQLKEIVKIKNMEAIPFAYSFEGNPGDLKGSKDPTLKFFPMAGVVPALGEVPITVTIQPSAERSYNYNATCFVRKKSLPLALNIKGEGYEIHESITAELADASSFELVTGQGLENVLDFGLVQYNERKTKRIVISNQGKVTFDFRWNFETKNNGPLHIQPEFGSVGKDEQVVCELVFLPTSAVQLKPSRMSCAITNGRTYPVTVYGAGRKPPLRLTISEFDFGAHFLMAEGVVPPETKVTIRNDDSKEMTFAILPSENRQFDIACGTYSLVAGEETEMIIRFYPRTIGKLVDTVQIEVNGLSKVDLVLKGEGTEFKVDLMSPEYRNINFGALRAGLAAQKTFQLVNKSSIPANFRIGPKSVLDRLKQLDIDLTVRDEHITLKPRGVYSIDVKFTPKYRRSLFSEELFLTAPGITRPLLIVSGACQGVDVKLESDMLAFGAVVHRSSTTRKLQIMNTGDVGIRFRWDTSKFEPHFSISPAEGYISAGMDVALEIAFHPTNLNPDVRIDNLVCEIEGGKKLFLTLSGSCILAPSQNEIIRFAVPVRQSETKSVSISNKSSNMWHIRPIIENPYWTGASETIEVEPGQTKQFDLTYTPLEMTSDNNKHEGSVFFPLPDGSGLLYKLSGTTDKPLPEATISRDIVCKTNHDESLKVANWLKRPQRFRVVFEVQKPDPSTIIKGNEYIDVPGQSSRDYKMSIYAYRECASNVKIWFKNESTQEYLFYAFAFKAVAPGVFECIELATPVRRQLVKDLVVENPLVTPVSFTTTVNSPDITVPHSFTVQPK